jgi:hypothetical protein
MKFTPENLIENIQVLGAWSAYGLASEALEYYYPSEYKDNDCILGARREIELLNKLDCDSWHDVVIKYQNEVGYNCKEFDKDLVNGF